MIIKYKTMKKIFKIIFFDSLLFSRFIGSYKTIEALYGPDCDWVMLQEIEPASQEIEADLSSLTNSLSEKIGEFKEVNKQINEKFEQPLFSKSETSRPRPRNIRTRKLIIDPALLKFQKLNIISEELVPEEYLKAKKEFAEYLYTEKKFKKLKEDIEKTEK